MNGAHSGNGVVSANRKAKYAKYKASGRREANKDRRAKRIEKGFLVGGHGLRRQTEYTRRNS